MDVEVLDCNQNGTTEDDWDNLSTVMENPPCQLQVDPNLGWPNYVHAFLEPPLSEPLVKIKIEPNMTEPGWGTSAPRSYSPDNLLREFSIIGSVDPSLADDNGNYNGQLVFNVDEIMYSGYHMLPGRPMIHDTNPTTITGNELSDNNGEFYDISYIDTCEWGGQYQVNALYIEAGNLYKGSDTLTIMFDYLIERPEHVSIVDTGRTSFHPENQYIDDAVVYMVPIIVERFYFKIDSAALGPEHPIVYMNDISVPPGGRFAINNWQDSHHQTHRQGAHADMYYEGWDYGSEIWKCMLSAIRYATQMDPAHDKKNHHNHFHVRFPARYWGP